MRRAVCIGLLLGCAFVTTVRGAETPVPRWDKTEAWLTYQALPNLIALHSSRAGRFAFEWEVTPLIYSFDMTRLVSPWHAFVVTPTERFSGSCELVARGFITTRSLDGTLFGGSIEALAHIPVIERGEHFGLNVGVSETWYGTSRSLFLIGGVNTLFGLVHLNLRFSPRDHVWITALELRLF